MGFLDKPSIAETERRYFRVGDEPQKPEKPFLPRLPTPEPVKPVAPSRNPQITELQQQAKTTVDATVAKLAYQPILYSPSTTFKDPAILEKGVRDLVALGKQAEKIGGKAGFQELKKTVYAALDAYTNKSSTTNFVPNQKAVVAELLRAALEEKWGQS
jgi:hypothetical protein